MLVAAALLTAPAWDLLTAAADADELTTGSLAPPPGPVVEGEPAPVVGHPDPLSLLESEDPALAANKRLVFDMWRGILNAGHMELADEFLAAGYMQHSPLLPTGRAAFKQVMSAIPRRDEIPELIEPAVIAMIAEGDLVAMTFIEDLPEPDGSGTYTTTHFNLFRIENGRLAEHWHSLQGPPGPDLPLPEDGGPVRVTGATGVEQLALLESAHPRLAANKRLVFDMYRNVIDANREELADLYIAEDYIQHNPNVATGREAIKPFLASRDDVPIEPSLRAPLVASVAEGDLVVQAVMFEHPDPRHVGRTYTSTGFDMFRIEDGMLVEHWDAATKAPPPGP
jgi:predicted SnoaL-like aldol condensation-catalyzing enzyme